MALNKTYFESNGRDVTNPIPIVPPYVPPTPPTPPVPDPGDDPVIPRPTFTGNMDCVLYINDCDRFMIHKDDYLETVLETTISIKDAVSVVNPVIMINTDIDIRHINYMKLGNYYYYASVELIPGGNNGALYRITGKRDPLTSFKDRILMLDVIVDKNEYDINPYLDDGSYVVEERQKIETISFPYGFNDSGTHILITAGGA